MIWLLLDRSGLIHAAKVPSSGCPDRDASAAAAAGGRLVLDAPIRPGDTTFGMGLGACISSGRVPGLRIPEPEHGALLRAFAAAPSVGGLPADRALERELVEEQWTAFRALLNQDALDTMRRARRKTKGNGSAGIYNLFAGAGAPEGMEAQAGEWRRRAFDGFPLFAAEIKTDPSVLAAIDGSAPLIAALAASRGLLASTVRALAGSPFGEGIRPKFMGFVTALADVTPPDWLPSSGEGWEDFLALTRTLTAVGVLKTGYKEAPGPGGLASGWTAPPSRARLLEEAIRRNGRNFAAAAPVDGAVAHMTDTGLALGLEVILPAMREIGAADGLELAAANTAGQLGSLGTDWLFATRSPRAALRVSAAHLTRHLAAGTAASRREGSLPSWSGLGADAVSPDGIAIVNLRSQAALEEEGVAMRHCVGSYGWRCADGVTAILSIREPGPDGEVRLSTAEVRVGCDGRPWTFQHRAWENSVPVRRASAAIAWYLEAAMKGEIASNLRDMAAAATRASLRNSGSDVWYAGAREPQAASMTVEALLDAAAGFEWRSAAARDATWANWARLLGADGTSGDWVSACPDVVINAEPDCPFRRALAGHRATRLALAA
jgi:hypothetical protein